MTLKRARTVSFKTMVEDKDAEYHLVTSEAGEIFNCFGKGVKRDWRIMRRGCLVLLVYCVIQLVLMKVNHLICGKMQRSR